MTSDEQNFQQTFDVLAFVPPAEIAQLRRFLRKRVYLADEVLLNSGVVGTSVFFLVCGRIRSEIDDGDEEPTVVSFCAKGELLGEINALSAGGHSATVIAENVCTAWEMSVADFNQCLLAMPQFHLNVSALLARRIRKATKQIQVLAVAQTERRVAFNLHTVAGFTHTLTTGKAKHQCVSVSIQHLALMSGCSREQLHRVLEKMRKEKIIERAHGTIRILDFTALEAFGKKVAGGGVRRLKKFEDTKK